jgi:hypothetical protein
VGEGSVVEKLGALPMGVGEVVQLGVVVEILLDVVVVSRDGGVVVEILLDVVVVSRDGGVRAQTDAFLLNLLVVVVSRGDGGVGEVVHLGVVVEILLDVVVVSRDGGVVVDILLYYVV